MVSGAARARGAKLLGVGFAGAKDTKGRQINSPADVMFGARDIAERKDALLDLGDVAIALAGGIGTLDEIGTFLERKKGLSPMPPLILLNTAGYYNGLVKQIDAMDEEAFMFDRSRDLIRVADTPQAAIELAETLRPYKYGSKDLEFLEDLIAKYPGRADSGGVV
jgi:predicted Rossmann-fold nucleotide-binding protein